MQGFMSWDGVFVRLQGYTKKTRKTTDIVSPNQNLPFEIPKAMDIVWMVPCDVLRLPTHLLLAFKMDMRMRRDLSTA